MEKKDSMTGGLGTLRVTANLWDHLGVPESPEQWRESLKLPTEYHVERVEYHEVTDLQGLPCDYFELFVRHSDIPLVEEDGRLPEISPMYTASHIGTRQIVSFDCVEIYMWRDGKYERVN